MTLPLLIFSQSDYLIWIVAINSHALWQTVQIQISWLLQKPTDLDLHCLQRQGISGFSRTRVKAPYSSKIDIFIQERLNKLIYGIDTIIKCGIWQPVKFHKIWHLWTCKISVSLSFLKWIKNEIIFYHISELMLATFFLRYNKNHFIFDKPSDL